MVLHLFIEIMIYVNLLEYPPDKLCFNHSFYITKKNSYASNAFISFQQNDNFLEKIISIGLSFACHRQDWPLEVLS